MLRNGLQRLKLNSIQNSSQPDEYKQLYIYIDHFIILCIAP